MNIGLIGGTGKQGRGLALRWARAGHAVAVGSRDPERGRAAAEELTRALEKVTANGGGAAIAGGGNPDIASTADIAVLCVPYAVHAATLADLKEALAGRIVVDLTVPLQPPRIREVNLPPGGAAALEARDSLGPDARVVAALHHVSSVHLADLDHAIDCDVLVCGDDADAKARVIALVADLGLRGLDAGGLANAVALESLTPVLLHLNRQYKIKSCGLRITGLPDQAG